MIKREDYNVMNSKAPKTMLPIKRAYVNENNDLVLINEGNGVYIPTSMSTFKKSLDGLDSKFFTEEFSDAIRDFALKKVLKNDSSFIAKTSKTDLEASEKTYELVKKSVEIDALLINKQQQREAKLNQKAINTFVNAFNSMSKTTSKQSDNIETK